MQDHHRMLKLEPGNQQCVGPENTNQFCQVLNQMYGNNYQYYEGVGGTPSHHQQPQQRCVTDYLTAYRQSHKQHYIQVSSCSHHPASHISLSSQYCRQFGPISELMVEGGGRLRSGLQYNTDPDSQVRRERTFNKIENQFETLISLVNAYSLFRDLKQVLTFFRGK